MNRHLAPSLALVSLALAACDDKPAAPPAATTATAAAPTGVVTAAHSATAASTAVATGDPGAFGRFHAVAAGASTKIYPMGDAAVVDTGAFYALLGDGPLEQDPQLFRSSIDRGGGKIVMTATERFSRFFGTWPDQAWGEREDGLAHRVNELWTKESPLRDNERVLDIAPWGQKRAVAAIRMEQPDIRFTLVGSSSGGVIPAPGKPTPEQDGCAVRMDPDGELKLGGLPSGHMFAIGKECKSGKFIAERWAPGKVRGEVDAIEGVSGAPFAVAAASGDEAYAIFNDGSTGHLATWDGKAWKAEKAPFGAGKSLWVSGDGVAWALGAEGLYQHPKGGAWTKVDVGQAKPTSAWAKDEKTIWVVADGKTLLRSGPASSGSAPFELPTPSAVNEVLTRDRRWLATPVCKRTYVMIAAVGSGDKAPTSYPALTDAVKGNAELTVKEIQYLVEDVGGTLWAGAKVPSVAVADKLVAALKAKNDKTKPMVFCHEPMFVKGALKVE